MCRKSLMSHGPSSPCAWTARSPDGVNHPKWVCDLFIKTILQMCVDIYICIYNVYMCIHIYIYILYYAYVYISRFELNHPKHGHLSFEPQTSRNLSGLLTPQQLTPRSFLRLHGRSVRTGPCHEFLTVSAQLSGYQFRRVCAETKNYAKKTLEVSLIQKLEGDFFWKTLSDPWKLRIIAYYSAKLSLPGTLMGSLDCPTTSCANVCCNWATLAGQLGKKPPIWKHWGNMVPWLDWNRSTESCILYTENCCIRNWELEVLQFDVPVPCQSGWG